MSAAVRDPQDQTLFQSFQNCAEMLLVGFQAVSIPVQTAVKIVEIRLPKKRLHVPQGMCCFFCSSGVRKQDILLSARRAFSQER